MEIPLSVDRRTNEQTNGRTDGRVYEFASRKSSGNKGSQSFGIQVGEAAASAEIMPGAERRHKSRRSANKAPANYRLISAGDCGCGCCCCSGGAKFSFVVVAGDVEMASLDGLRSVEGGGARLCHRGAAAGRGDERIGEGCGERGEEGGSEWGRIE